MGLVYELQSEVLVDVEGMEPMRTTAIASVLAGLIALLIVPAAQANKGKSRKEERPPVLEPEVTFTPVNRLSTLVTVENAMARRTDYVEGPNNFRLVKKRFLIPSKVAKALQENGPLRVSTYTSELYGCVMGPDGGFSEVRLWSGRGTNRVLVEHASSFIGRSSKGRKRNLWIQRGVGKSAELVAAYGGKKGKWSFDQHSCKSPYFVRGAYQPLHGGRLDRYRERCVTGKRAKVVTAAAQKGPVRRSRR